MGGVLAAALLALPVASHAAEVPSGTDITNGMAVHITPQGVGFLQDQVKYIVPTSVAVPNQGGDVFSCLFDTNTWSLTNGVVHLQVGKVIITPIEGALQLHIEISVSADAHVSTSGCLVNLGCDISIPPSPVTADTTIDLAMQNVQGQPHPQVVATVPAFATQLNLAGVDFNCGLGGDILSLIESLFNGSVQSAINNAINNQVAPMLQPAIQNAFNSLALSGSTSLSGVELDYDFYPTGLAIHPGTIGIVMGGHFSTPNPAACIDPARGSVVMGGDLPNYGATSPSGAQYHAAVSLADDLLNQLVFSAWRGGLLCRNIDSAGGQPLTTDMLTLIGGQITKVVTPGGPMVVQLLAEDPPLITLGGPNGATAEISVSNLHVDLMADVNERLARILRLTLGANATLTVAMNADHQIVVTPNFDPSAIQGTVDYDELAPDAAQTVINLLPTLVTTLVPNLANAIPPIDLPALDGVTIDSAEIVPDGPQSAFLSVYTGLGGHVNSGGCNAGSTGGCGVSGGTGTGCTIGGTRTLDGAVISPMMLGLGLAVVFVRRRRG